MNAITLLKQDHHNVEELFHRFEHLAEDDAAARRQLADKVIEQLSRHASVEEQLFYPAVRNALAEAKGPVLESLEEHHLVKVTLWELERLPASNDRFAAKMSVLIDSVRHHVEEEEQELFPKAREALNNQQLEELGDAMERVKAAAPSRAHPLAPDTPPLNAFIAMPVAILDRAVRTGREAVGRVLKLVS